MQFYSVLSKVILDLVASCKIVDRMLIKFSEFSWHVIPSICRRSAKRIGESSRDSDSVDLSPSGAEICENAFSKRFQNKLQ